MKKDNLTFDTHKSLSMSIKNKKSLVRFLFIDFLNKDGFVPLNVKMEKYFFPDRIDVVWLATAICAKTTKKLAREIKEIKKRKPNTYYYETKKLPKNS